MSILGVADTHTTLWYMYGDARLSEAARTFVRGALDSGCRIGVSSISLVEVVYLVEKRRVLATCYDDVAGLLRDPREVFVEIPVSAEIAEAMRRVPRDDVPDMPDRIVAATGLQLGVPVISRDGRIRAARLTTIC